MRIPYMNPCKMDAYFDYIWFLKYVLKIGQL